MYMKRFACSEFNVVDMMRELWLYWFGSSNNTP